MKYLVWQASLSPNNNLEKIGLQLKNEVTRKISIERTSRIIEYNRKTFKKEDPLNIIKKQESDIKKTGKINCEIQDFYLSDPQLPSNRGHLGMDDWIRYPYLATNLGLINDENWSIKSRGHVFLKIVPPIENRAFKESEDLYSKNPFKLSRDQSIFLIYCLIENDGDVLKKLYPSFSILRGVFTEKEAGDLIPEVYNKIASESIKRKKKSNDQIAINKILETSKKIKALENTSGGGGKNAREHSITYRLEAFVDFNLLKKPDPFEYRYEKNEKLIKFFSKVDNCISTEEFLLNSFFSSTLDLFEQRLGILQDDVILTHLKNAYNSIKNSLGYALMIDLAILTSINGILNNNGYIEINEVYKFLQDLHKQKPELIRFQVDRQGKVKFVKFL